MTHNPVHLDVPAAVVAPSLSQVAHHGLSLVLLLQRLLVEERSYAWQRDVVPLEHAGLHSETYESLKIIVHIYLWRQSHQTSPHPTTCFQSCSRHQFMCHR